MEKNFAITDALSRAVDVLKENAAYLILTPILYWVMSQICSSFGTGNLSAVIMENLPMVISGEMDQDSFSQIVAATEIDMFLSIGFWISALISWVLAVVYNVGYYRFQLQAIDGKELSGNSFRATTNTYLNYFLCSLIIGVTLTIGFCCCILPGIYLSVRLFLAPYYVVDRDMKALDAIKACWNDMQGNWTKIFVAAVWLLLISIAGVMLCCVGTLFTTPLVGVASAIFYREISKD